MIHWFLPPLQCQLWDPWFLSGGPRWLWRRWLRPGRWRSRGRRWRSRGCAKDNSTISHPPASLSTDEDGVDDDGNSWSASLITFYCKWFCGVICILQLLFLFYFFRSVTSSWNSKLNWMPFKFDKSWKTKINSWHLPHWSYWQKRSEMLSLWKPVPNWVMLHWHWRLTPLCTTPTPVTTLGRAIL